MKKQTLVKLIMVIISVKFHSVYFILRLHFWIYIITYHSCLWFGFMKTIQSYTILLLQKVVDMFCLVEITQTMMSPIALFILLESPWWIGMHKGGFTMFNL
jgi:hypothetical protein